MDRASRELLIRKAILDSLIQCEGFMVPEPALRVQVELMVVPEPSRGEMDEAIKFLDVNRWISTVHPAGGGPRKFRITDLGRSSRGEM